VKSTVLVTGAAGFIGLYVSLNLLRKGYRVVGIDNLNDYYDVSLKEARLKVLAEEPNFLFRRQDVVDSEALSELFREFRFESVIHLAAQAGVRYSIENPSVYIQSNLVGFGNMLECCRRFETKHLTYASSSSVYGLNRNTPFQEGNDANHQVSLYGATKKANELMAHTYSHLFGLPTTGLRFFTVYGPWGRPDMAPMLFADAILSGRPIKVFNHGKMKRDFTFVEDIAEGVVAISERPAAPDPEWDPMRPKPQTSSAPFRIYNIGNSQPVELMRFIEILEQSLGKPAIKEFLPMQQGDVLETHADTSALEHATGVRPNTSIEDGVAKFAAWYLEYRS